MHFVYVINIRRSDSEGSGILKPEGLSFSLLAMEINLKHVPLNEIKFKAMTHCHKTSFYNISLAQKKRFKFDNAYIQKIITTVTEQRFSLFKDKYFAEDLNIVW